MQDSRSQHQNRAWAWEILRARLSDKKHQEEVERKRASRRNQVKGAGRGDKVRTYNFTQVSTGFGDVKTRADASRIESRTTVSMFRGAILAR
jgi:protein subunit release factor B